MPLQIARALACIAAAQLAFPWAASAEVLNLGATALADRLADEAPVAVLFRQRACVGCEAAEVVWDDAAVEAEKRGLAATFARVDAPEFHVHDATDAHKRLRGVAYPAVRLFRWSVALTYKPLNQLKDTLDAGDVVTWLAEKCAAKPQVRRLEGADDARAWAEEAKAKLALVGFGEPSAKAVHAAAWAIDGGTAAAEVLGSADELQAVREALGAGTAGSGGGVLLLRPFRFERRAAWHPEPAPTSASVLDFFDEESRQSLMFARKENEEIIFDGGEPGAGLVILFADEEQELPAVQALAAVAEGLREEQRLKFVWAKPDAYGSSLANMLHVSKDDHPLLLIKEFGASSDNDKIWRFQDTMQSQALDEEHVRGFVQRWLNGGVIAEAEVVIELTSQNFKRVTEDETRHVFVTFYVQGDPGCRQLAPIWTQLARRFGDSPDLLMARVDYEAHPVVVRPTRPKAFPHIIFYPRRGGAKKAPDPVEYKGKRYIEELAAFVEKQREGVVSGGRKDDEL